MGSRQRPDRVGYAAHDQLLDFSAGQDLPTRYFDAVIYGLNGTRLSATVFHPALIEVPQLLPLQSQLARR